MDKIEFNTMMEKIDEELRVKGIPIPGRPIAAGCEVSKLLKVRILFFPRLHDAMEGIYNELTLAAHIDDWYESRYGNRLKMHFELGSVAFIIRDEPWRLFLPRIYGTADILCDPDLEKYSNVPYVEMTKGKPLICNAPNYIDQFTAGVARLLTIEERKQILTFFTDAFYCFDNIEKILDKPYIKEAKADLESSVSHIFTQQPQYGLSKWYYLQFIEKLLKSFLKFKNEPIPMSHDLADIARRGQDIGLAPLDSDLLVRVQCNAGVRYGEPPVTLQEAIDAHHAALALSMKLTKEIRLIDSAVR